MLVSIIIPIFKVQQYITRCLTSVLNQTYRQLEVILIDDCSPDDSMSVAQDVIRNSPDSADLLFKFIRHEVNRGQSAARNTGIKAASGDYIFFIDSDDEITSTCIETLVLESCNGTIDVVCGGLNICGEVDLFKSSKNFDTIDAFYDSFKDIVNAFAHNQIPHSAWNKLLRRSCVIENDLFFKEGLLCEDNLWTFILAHSVDTLKLLSAKTYKYWIHPGSTITTMTLAKGNEYWLTIMEEQENFLKIKKKENPITRNYLLKYKADWIQTRMVDKRIPFKERWHLVSSVLSLGNRYKIIMLSLLYFTRRVLFQIKNLVCH